MIKWLILFMCLSFNAYAGFTVCHDGSGNITNSGTCVYYSDQTTGTDAHDRVKSVMNSVNSSYLKWTTEPVEMTQAEKDAVDSQALTNRNSLLRTSTESSIDSFTSEGIRLRAALLVIMDEINLLRAQHSLADRTETQLKDAIKTRISNGDAD